ncbi:MAG: hypothetical protein AAF847_03530 [Bacteroidota bacterium]
MSKPRRNIRKKRRTRSRNIRYDDLSAEMNDLFNSALLKGTDTEIEMLSTPFGEIPYSDGMIAFQLKHKKLLLEIMSFDAEQNNPLEHLIFLEKAKDKYPNEPFLENSIAECYLELGRKEAHQQKVEENFERFKGDPSIDLSYIRLKGKEEEAEQTFHKIFGEELNIAKIYPNFKAFDEAVICDFYTEAAFHYDQIKAYDMAKACLEVVGIFKPREAIQLSELVDLRSDPKKKRALLFKGILFLLFVLAVIVGIIWGIVKLFQWIF